MTPLDEQPEDNRSDDESEQIPADARGSQTRLLDSGRRAARWAAENIGDGFAGLRLMARDISRGPHQPEDHPQDDADARAMRQVDPGPPDDGGHPTGLELSSIANHPVQTAAPQLSDPKSALTESGLDQSWEFNEVLPAADQAFCGEGGEADTLPHMAKAAIEVAPRAAEVPQSQQPNEADLDAIWGKDDIAPPPPAQRDEPRLEIVSPSEVMEQAKPSSKHPSPPPEPEADLEAEDLEDTEYDEAIDDLEFVAADDEERALADLVDSVETPKDSTAEPPKESIPLPGLTELLDDWGDVDLNAPDEAEAEPLGLAADFDSLIDFETLHELDIDARHTAPSILRKQLPQVEHNRQVARTLGREAGWTHPEDLAVLEAIFEPLRSVGRAGTVIRHLLHLGITSAELAAAHRLRRLWPQFACLIQPESRRRRAGKGFLAALTWPQAWETMDVIGVDLDEEELSWLLDRARIEWFERYRAQQLGQTSAFEVTEEFREFVLELFRGDHGNRSDIPYWADDNLRSKSNLHLLHLDNNDEQEYLGASPWL